MNLQCRLACGRIFSCKELHLGLESEQQNGGSLETPFMGVPEYPTTSPFRLRDSKTQVSPSKGFFLRRQGASANGPTRAAPRIEHTVRHVARVQFLNNPWGWLYPHARGPAKAGMRNRHCRGDSSLCPFWGRGRLSGDFKHRRISE